MFIHRISVFHEEEHEERRLADHDFVLDYDCSGIRQSKSLIRPVKKNQAVTMLNKALPYKMSTVSRIILISCLQFVLELNLYKVC